MSTVAATETIAELSRNLRNPCPPSPAGVSTSLYVSIVHSAGRAKIRPGLASTSSIGRTESSTM